LPTLQEIPGRRAAKSFPRKKNTECGRDATYGNLIDMGNPAIDTALDGLLDPLSRCLDAESARRVTEFRIDPAVQSRIDTLAERANNGVLSDEERAEYEAFINLGDFISILKLKARRHLDLNQI
jgi:hypothetical protein